MSSVAILDVDGTLVDTNYHHALAWYRAFRARGVTLPIWRIHRQIGRGGDQLVGALAGEDVERREGDAIRESETEEYARLIGEIQPTHSARRLISDLTRMFDNVILASSAKRSEVEYYLALLQVRDLVDGWTTADDVEATKPEPDLIGAAVGKVGARAGLMVGDSVWDCEAAARAGIPAVAVLSGGFADCELRDAGASAVYESLDELRAHLGDLPAPMPLSTG